jgi:hypothetical protein
MCWVPRRSPRAFPGSKVRAEEKIGDAVPKQELQAKTEYCKTCYGVSEQGFSGAFFMPRLAGQQPEYLESQLGAFFERRRTNPVMFNVGLCLKPGDDHRLGGAFRGLGSKGVRWRFQGTYGRRKKITKRACRGRIFRPVRPVMGHRQKGTAHCPVLPASLMIKS